MRQKIINTSFVAVTICFALIIVAMGFDWITKYYVYLNQRDSLYKLINAGEDYEALKKTVSYLQGTATRQLNKLKDVTITFGLVFASFSIYTKIIKERLISNDKTMDQSSNYSGG